MIIKKAEAKVAVFEPFVVEITIQSQQEQLVLDDLCSYNVTIPNVFPEGSRRDIVFNLLKLLRAAIRT